MINTATQSNLAIHAFVVGQMLCIWSFMAYFKTITRDMIVRRGIKQNFRQMDKRYLKFI